MLVEMRAAGVEDIPVMRQLLAQLGYRLNEQQLSSRLESIAAWPSLELLVAELDASVAEQRRVVGLMLLGASPSLAEQLFAEVRMLVVDQQQRSRGIGAQLLRYAENWGREQRLPLLRVSCNSVRLDAHRFYVDQGFEQRKQQAVFVKSLDVD